MRILMITPYLPYPPSDGGQVRSYNLIKRLSHHHEITLVCFTREHNLDTHVDHMRQFCRQVLVFERGKAWTIKNVLRTGFSLYPFLVTIYSSPLVKTQLADLIKSQKFDLIHAETFYVLPYVPPTDLPIVLVEQTIMSRVFSHFVEIEPKLWLKPLLAIDVAKIAFWEKYYWRRANRLVAVSDEDAWLMRRMVSTIKVDVVPNGVGEAFENLNHKIHYNHTLLYMGNYKWMQNWEAAQILARDVFPLIKKEIPDARLAIAGQFPPPALKKLESQDVSIIELADHDEAGVVAAYQGAGLLVAPIYGPGGTRLKILAAMAAMVPVVTTPIGAEGYGAKDNVSILIGDTPQGLARKAVQVLKDRTLYTRVAENGRKLVASKFTWEPITRHLESIYHDMQHAAPLH